MQIKIPFKTPSVNHLYFVWKGRKILTKEARALKKEIAEIIGETGIIGFSEKPLKVSVDIYENWFCKNGEVYKKDIANREKFLIDAVFEALEMDDKFIFESKFKKIQSETEEAAIITIEVL